MAEKPSTKSSDTAFRDPQVSGNGAITDQRQDAGAVVVQRCVQILPVVPSRVLGRSHDQAIDDDAYGQAHGHCEKDRNDVSDSHGRNHLDCERDG